jgi:two-component sensor histidine kinase
MRLEWRESGGPAVAPPTRTGFGSRMIKTLLAKDFGGSVELT